MSAPDRLAQAFEAQAIACDALGSPFMGRLMRLLDGAIPAGPLRERIASWPGDVSNRGDSVPLRLAGGLHALVRAGDPLAAAYPPHEADDETLRAVLRDAMDRNSDALLGALDGPPQTNEIRRAACLIAAAHLLTGRHRLPLVLSELGASAGLNLLFDRFALETPDGPRGPSDPILTLAPEWRGAAVPPDARPVIRSRAGVDRAPIDVRDPAQRTRLLSYLWPDQPFRLEMTRTVIEAGPPPLDRGEAVDWLGRRLAVPHPGALHLVYHTVFRQYLSAEARRRMEGLLADAGRMASPAAPLAHLAMEEEDGPEKGAVITLTTWPGGRTETLGRLCFHGRWIDWRAAA